MGPDHDQTGKPIRRSHAAPVPGMPYRPHVSFQTGDPADGRQAFEFIESRPVDAQQDAPAQAYNPWEEQGWEGRETAFPPLQEPEILQEERYFKPMLDLDREMPGAYGGYADYAQEDAYPPGYMQENTYPPGYEQEDAYSPDFKQENVYPPGYAQEDAYPPGYAQEDAYPPAYGQEEPYIPGPPDPEEPEYAGAQEPPVPPPSMPPDPKEGRRSEPWRTAVILCCIAGLLFCGVEIYRVAQNIIQSETELREFRGLYLKEHNEDFMKNAQAVALRPPGETYPPTASPVPVQTPTPTPRIEQNDPLIGVMNGGIDPNQSVAPVTPTPETRSSLERYPANPLLVIRDEMAALQEENEDVIGRLVIDGLLSEIVVLRNNTYYLNHNAMGSYSGYGAVFADETLTLRTPPENILLYGRTSSEGKCFAPLKNYISQGIEFAGRYAFLSFNSLYEEARYVIFAVIQASSDPASADYFDYRNLTFTTDGEMLRYAENAIARSKYLFKVGVKPTDRLLTLVTLSDGTDTSGIVIVCRMLRDGERDGYIQSSQ